jgi:hypothetical protein
VSETIALRVAHGNEILASAHFAYWFSLCDIRCGGCIGVSAHRAALWSGEQGDVVGALTRRSYTSCEIETRPCSRSVRIGYAIAGDSGRVGRLGVRRAWADYFNATGSRPSSSWRGGAARTVVDWAPCVRAPSALPLAYQVRSNDKIK